MPKNPSLDVCEVFRNPESAIAVLKAGNTIVLIDDDGKSFARHSRSILYGGDKEVR